MKILSNFSYLGEMITPKFFLYLLLLFIINVLGIRSWKNLNLKYRFLLLLVSVTFISEIISRFFALWYNNTSAVYHFLMPIFCILYYAIFSIPRKNKKWIGLVFALAFLICIANSVFVQSLRSFPTNSLIALSFSLVIATLFDFDRLRLAPKEMDLHKMGDFWFDIGTLFFYSLTFFAYSMMRMEQFQIPAWIYNFIYFANIVLYLCYLLAFIFERKSKKWN